MDAEMDAQTVRKTYKCEPTTRFIMRTCRSANMVKHHHLAKSIQDAGWGAFLIILTYKAACAGRRAVAVNPAYTSQQCSGCGAIVSKGLSVRWHSCPDCGTSLHRDQNAAKNRERAGQALRGVVT